MAKPSFRTIDRDEDEIKRIELLFSSVTVRGLTTAHVEDVITQMRKDGVSEQTIFKMYKKLRQILKRPTITSRIDFNPCDLDFERNAIYSRGIVRVKHGGYVGPSYKSLRSFGATYLIGENVDVKAAQAHFGHKRSSTTLELYAEQVPKHEREVAKTMDAFVKAALGNEAPEEQSLEAFREAIATLPPSEWPDWVREIADLVGTKSDTA